MIIHGLQKLTLLDYPGKVACTIFTGGCNFRCPFCHNASLVLPEQFSKPIQENEVISFLKKRKGVLDAVCITGGEPLLQPDILEFIKKIKNIGYLVKLDTNGSFPDRLKEIVSSGVIDYVAMDIKNSEKNYAKTCGLEKIDFDIIKKSVDFLLSGPIEYEFRTTAVREFHNDQAFRDITTLISGAKNYFIQNYIDSGDTVGEKCSSFTEKELSTFIEIVRPYVKNISTRGI